VGEPGGILASDREHFAVYEIPREIRVVEALLRTATGKIAKLELKKQM